MLDVAANELRIFPTEVSEIIIYHIKEIIGTHSYQVRVTGSNNGLCRKKGCHGWRTLFIKIMGH